MDIGSEFYEYMVQDNVLISYAGQFDSNLLSALASNIENNIKSNPVIAKKIYKIFIELTHNISLYSLERIVTEKIPEGVGCGTIILKEFNDYYLLTSANMASKIDIDPIIERCSAINSLSREQLRDYKRQQRKLPSSRKGGGNIGLIQVALTADNPLDFKHVTLNEGEYFYLVSVKINKNATGEE